MSTLTLQLPDSLRQELDELSKNQKQPIEEFAAELLRRQLAVMQFRELRRQTIPYAQAAGFHTDEDVFKVIS